MKNSIWREKDAACITGADERVEEEKDLGQKTI